MVQWMRSVVSSRIDDAAGVMTIDAGGVGNAPTKMFCDGRGSRNIFDGELGAISFGVAPSHLKVKLGCGILVEPLIGRTSVDVVKTERNLLGVHFVEANTKSRTVGLEKYFQ